MDDLLKMILMDAMASSEKPDLKTSAKDVAKLNKELYNAHMEQGFTSEQSIMLVSAIISLGGRR